GVEAAEPLGIPVLPVLAYGITPGFGAFPGSPTLRLETFAAVVCDILESLYGQGFRRFLIANAHGGNPPGAVAAAEWRRTHEDAAVLWHDVWEGRPDELAAAIEDRKSTRLNSSHLVISYAVFCLKKKKKDISTNYASLSTPALTKAGTPTD